MSNDPTILPRNLPAPIDDGAAGHLMGAAIPVLALRSSKGADVKLADFTRTPCVIFFYPRTGVPGVDAPALADGTPWDLVPGMRGCTPQSCSFRDLASDFASLGVRIAAISTQTAEYQREFAQRMHIPFPILSDSDLALTRSLRLPSIDMPIERGGPGTLIRRMAWFCDQGYIERVWYPVFPPNENAATVLSWLRANVPARSE